MHFCFNSLGQTYHCCILQLCMLKQRQLERYETLSSQRYPSSRTKNYLQCEKTGFYSRINFYLAEWRLFLFKKLLWSTGKRLRYCNKSGGREWLTRLQISIETFWKHACCVYYRLRNSTLYLRTWISFCKSKENHFYTCTSWEMAPSQSEKSLKIDSIGVQVKPTLQSVFSNDESLRIL